MSAPNSAPPDSPETGDNYTGDHSERKTSTAAKSTPNVADSAVVMWQSGMRPVVLASRGNTKRPVDAHWPDRVFKSEVELRRAFGRGANLGVALGGGFADVDLDTDEAIAAAAHLLPSTPVRHGKPSTPEAHGWYRIADGGGFPYVKLTGAVDPATKKSPTLVELRADPGHQTMVPPSMHPDEKAPLRWKGTDRPWDAPVVEESTLTAAVGAVGVAAALAPFWPGEGRRHSAALNLAGALLRDAYDDARYVAKVEAIISTLAVITGDEEASDRAAESVPSTCEKLSRGAEVTGWTSLRDDLDADHPEQVTAAAKAAAKVMREAMGVPPEGGDPLAGLSDLGGEEILSEVPDDWGEAGLFGQQRIASRFAAVAKGKCLYVHGTGWHWWDGSRWAPDHGEVHAHRILKALLRTSMTTAMSDSGLLAAIKSSSNAAGVRGVLSLASKEPGLWVDQVDAKPNLLNCRNGTLDLETFELRAADPADHITKVTAADYRPSAAGPEWGRLLSGSLPDPELRGYLQRFVGLSLLGCVEEHLIVFAYGKGRNGKGVTAYTIQKALGDYGVTASNDLLVKKGHSKSAGDYAAIMQLRGARWAVMSEIDKGTKVDVAALKSITGGDRQSAKAMGKDFVNFDPSHMLFLLTNHLPVLSSDEGAAWDRVKVLPYDVSFSGREDTRLTHRLETEFEAVLAWAVEGLRQYRERGMGEPEAVTAATSAYRKTNDVFDLFFQERCERVPGEKVRASLVRDEFNEWALRYRHPSVSAPEWKALLAEGGATAYGLEWKRPGGVPHLYGMRLRNPGEPGE